MRSLANRRHLPITTSPAVAAALFSALLLFALASVAQLPGTMFGVIQDENGEPVPGVTIRITDPEAPDFEQVETSNKRGRYRLMLKNATKRYTFKLSKEGFQTVTLNGVKIPATKDTRRNFNMSSAAAAQAAAAEGGGDVDPEAAAKGGATKTYNDGVNALNAGDMDTALLYFESALEKDPSLGIAHAALAKVLVTKGEHAKALAAAERAVELEVDKSSLSQVFYAAYSALGEEEKAEATLAEMQASDPEKAGQNLFNEGAELYNGGNMAEAKAVFERLLAVDSEHPRAHYMIGMIYASESSNDKAKEHFEKFIELAPNDPEAATAQEMLKYLNN